MTDAIDNPAQGSETPRTDAAWDAARDESMSPSLMADEMFDFARTLERELTAAESALVIARKRGDDWKEATIDLAQRLQTAESALAVKRERVNDLEDATKALLARAEAAESALAEANERIKKLEYDLMVQTEAGNCLGRAVREKDEDRIFFRDQAAILQSQLAAAQRDAGRWNYVLAQLASGNDIVFDAIPSVMNLGGLAKPTEHDICAAIDTALSATSAGEKGDGE